MVSTGRAFILTVVWYDDIAERPLSGTIPVAAQSAHLLKALYGRLAGVYFVRGSRSFAIISRCCRQVVSVSVVSIRANLAVKIGGVQDVAETFIWCANMIGTRRAYLFEAKGIQRWVMDGGRLRDIASSSALLARVARSDCDDLLGAVLDVTGFSPRWSRRAGGAFMLHYDASDEPLFERFRSLWRLTFMLAMPGLEFTEAIGEGESELEAHEAVRAPSARLSACRENSLAGLLPQGHPLTVLCGRTGRPAVEVWKPGSAHEPIDAVTLAKRRAGAAGDDVANMLSGAFGEDVIWPDRMEPTEGDNNGATFPFGGTDGWVAIIHADISALGDFYAAVGQAAQRSRDPIDTAWDASRAIEAAVAEAARVACERVLAGKVSNDGVVPARPILLGGDDITVIVRGDLALDFTEAFLESLEDESEVKLRKFAETSWAEPPPGVAVRLTAAAGVAFAGPKQPFFRLLDLAESLCGFAKRRAKQVGAEGARPPSVLAFYRVTESAISADAEGLFGRLTTPWGNLSCQPYRVGKLAAGDIADFAALRKLQGCLNADDLQPGPLRSLRSEMQQANTYQAEEKWRRWRATAKRRNKRALADLEAELRAMGADEAGVMEPLTKMLGEAKRTPVFDALEWRAIR